MRLAASLLFWLAAAAPAAAQACEASVFGKLGEVIALLPEGKANGPMKISWAIERDDEAGLESDLYSRPGLMLDFSMADANAPLVPSGAVVSITRVRDPATGRPATLTGIGIKATPKGAETVAWSAENPGRSEALLARRLQEQWPDELVIDLVNAADKVIASSVYNLSVRSGMETEARRAVADAVRKCGR